MDTTFTIESGIQIPHGKVNAKYPFRKMKVGDSFLIQQNGGGRLVVERSRVYALTVAKQMQVKVVTRTVEGGIRVWKVRGGK